MAQKALKTQASRNSATLNRTHLISVTVYLLFFLIRTFVFTRKLTPFLICTFPAIGIELWFERIGRPTYTTSPSGSQDLKRAGEDLEAKGLTEWMWDVVYWTWGVTVLVALAGDRAWWLYLAVPIYSAWLAFTTYSGIRKGFGGMGADSAGDVAGGQSKRQAKMEKRGGQKTVYR